MVGETTFERYAKHIAVAVVVLLILLPVYWMVNMSLKDRAEFAARPQRSSSSARPPRTTTICS